MSVYYGGSGVYVGSFNPPHIGHLNVLRLALEAFDRLHLFVRYNPGVDLVDWETKYGWFVRINEEMGGRLVIHRMMNEQIKGKTYELEDFIIFIRNTIRDVGEPVTGFVFGEEYEKIIPEFQKAFPDLHFILSPRPQDGEIPITSTAIRSDPEGHKAWLPAYVYESLTTGKEKKHD